MEDLREKHGFLVLRGNEITTDQGDMVVFGLDKNIQGIIQLEELRREVPTGWRLHHCGPPVQGLFHLWRGSARATPEKAMERPLFKLVDAVEVLNSKVTGKGK